MYASTQHNIVLDQENVKIHGDPTRSHHDWVIARHNNQHFLCHVLCFVFIGDLDEILQFPYGMVNETGEYAICHFVDQDVFSNARPEIHPELPISGTQVLIQLQKIIWSYILNTWQLHNNHLHLNAAHLNLPNYRQTAISLYKQHHQLPPAAQEALYQKPVEELLDLPAPQLQSWTQHGLKYFNQQLRAAKAQAIICTQDICTFLGPKTQQPNDLQPP